MKGPNIAQTMTNAIKTEPVLQSLCFAITLRSFRLTGTAHDETATTDQHFFTLISF